MKAGNIISLIYIILGALTILVPTVIFPVCAMCRMHTLPVLVILGALVIVLSVVSIAISNRRKD
jgi:hypothetical protein